MMLKHSCHTLSTIIGVWFERRRHFRRRDDTSILDLISMAEPTVLHLIDDRRRCSEASSVVVTTYGGSFINLSQADKLRVKPSSGRSEHIRLNMLNSVALAASRGSVTTGM